MSQKERYNPDKIIEHFTPIIFMGLMGLLSLAALGLRTNRDGFSLRILDEKSDSKKIKSGKRVYVYNGEKKDIGLFDHNYLQSAFHVVTDKKHATITNLGDGKIIADLTSVNKKVPFFSGDIRARFYPKNKKK